MSATPRMFDIELTQEFRTTNLVLKNQTKIPLEACREEHMNFNDELRAGFTKLGLANYFCPPLGQEFTVMGKITSDLYA